MNLVLQCNAIVLDAIRALGKVPETSAERARGGPPQVARSLSVIYTFPTPPFSEYTSGHSAFSMAAAKVLKQFTGSDRFGFYCVQNTPLRADPSEPTAGVVLSWATFSGAATQACESRLYGGIHFYAGNVVGLDIGRKCGSGAYARAKALWTGV